MRNWDFFSISIAILLLMGPPFQKKAGLVPGFADVVLSRQISKHLGCPFEFWQSIQS